MNDQHNNMQADDPDHRHRAVQHYELGRAAVRRLWGQLGALEALFGPAVRAALERETESATEHLSESAHFYRLALEETERALTDARDRLAQVEAALSGEVPF